MTHMRFSAALLATGLTAALLAGCGSDSSSSGSSGSGGGSDKPAAASGGGGGDVSGPCDLADQQTVASVFPGASAGKPGNIRNCEFAVTGSSTVNKVNLFYYEGIDLEAFKKQDKANDITFSTVDVGDGAIKDQLHTVTVQQGDVLFSVQALGDSVQTAALAKNDPQVLALAKKIAAQL